MARKQKSGQSPYQRHLKAPFKYSEVFEKWQEAAKANSGVSPNERDSRSRAHTKFCERLFGPMPGNDPNNKKGRYRPVGGLLEEVSLILDMTGAA